MGNEPAIEINGVYKTSNLSHINNSSTKIIII